MGIAKLLVVLVGLGLTCSATCGPAHGAEAKLTPSLICSVQNSVRWREPAWTPQKCGRVARSLNDSGLPRTLGAIGMQESDWRDHAVSWHGPNVVDAGFLGIRCLLDKHRRCTNGPAAGYTVNQLLDAEINIKVGAAILASKKSLGAYHSATPELGEPYAARILVLVDALGGINTAARNAKGKRMRELVRKILKAVARERSS